jgi:hypothetical protein
MAELVKIEGGTLWMKAAARPDADAVAELLGEASNVASLSWAAARFEAWVASWAEGVKVQASGVVLAFNGLSAGRGGGGDPSLTLRRRAQGQGIEVLGAKEEAAAAILAWKAELLARRARRSGPRRRAAG